jgi:catechol 2,3-dioxygenase
MADRPEGPTRPSSGAYIQHLVLRVRDLGTAHDFYTRILGFEQCAELEREKYPDFKMRFYRGSAERHHDLALAELMDPSSAPAPESPWQMFGNTPGVDHIAICYPDRDSWLNQIAWMKSQGVEFRVRGNHGMTHSAYVEDPDGNGVEVLYNLPDDVWSGDVNAALNHFEPLPVDGPEAMVDDTDYVSFSPANN